MYYNYNVTQVASNKIKEHRNEYIEASFFFLLFHVKKGPTTLVYLLFHCILKQFNQNNNGGTTQEYMIQIEFLS